MKKKVLLIASIPLAILLIVLLFVFNYTPGPVFNPLIIDGYKSHGLKLSSSINNQADNSVTITASVEPNYVLDKALDWNIEWASESTKNVNDYVSMSVSDDTLSSTILYLEVFDTQILVTATSKSNPEVSATCTVDCYKRVSSVYIDLAFETENDYIDLQGTSYSDDRLNREYISLDCRDLTYEEIIQNDFKFSLGEVVFTSVGTVESNTTYEATISIHPELRSILDNYGLAYNNDGSILNYNEDWNQQSFKDNLGISFDDNNYIKALAEASSWFNIILVFETENVEYDDNICYFSLDNFNISDGINVLAISLSESSLIF